MFESRAAFNYWVNTPPYDAGFQGEQNHKCFAPGLAAGGDSASPAPGALIGHHCTTRVDHNTVVCRYRAWSPYAYHCIVSIPARYVVLYMFSYTVCRPIRAVCRPIRAVCRPITRAGGFAES